ncbi:MAG TPA: crosslink repair DNA glycosylase YcaQ family protein [Anaerolineaceae bacterium]|nr:crosslink repair DNA glycosylase YcaQ family protein [Anaerolineaceae bacterium]
MTDLDTLRKRVISYREKTYRTARSLRLHSPQDALDFFNERGFIFFWPIKDYDLPNLWYATVGARPVPNNHDDPGHVTWGWKDGMLDKRAWYYAKLVRKKATILSLEMAPYFYALSPNYGDYENDYLLQYKSGQMSVEMKNVYEALLENGPLHTLDLHKQAHLTSSDKKYLFDKTLTDLQAEMKIIPVGIAVAGRWGYAMIYDIAARYYPEIVEKARFITEASAQQAILLSYLRSVGMADLVTIKRMFTWKEPFTSQACAQLVEQNHITAIFDADRSNPLYFINDIFHLQ